MNTDYKPRRAKPTLADAIDEYADKLDAHATRCRQMGWEWGADRDETIASELREIAERWES